MIYLARYACGVVVLGMCFLSGCGALTGLPGHGGGKRFAVEQELVSAASRGAIKQLDLKAIRGKKVNLCINAIGDTGVGNLIGGRFSVVSQLRGDYIQSPPTVESSVFPHFTTTTANQSSSLTDGSSSTTSGSTTKDYSETTGSSTNDKDETSSSSSSTSNSGDSAGSSSTVSDSSTESSSLTTTDSVLSSPEKKTTQQQGSGGLGQVGVEYKGLGAYQTSEEVTANDLQYLSALLQTYLFLQGVYVVPPSEAEIDVYVAVDVFGTVRTRVEWFLANNEILRAKTTFEIIAIDHLTGQLVMPPQTAGAEAEYNEQYLLWAGPVSIKKTLAIAEPLLCDFTEFSENNTSLPSAEQDIAIPYPFRYQMKKWGQDE